MSIKIGNNFGLANTYSANKTNNLKFGENKVSTQSESTSTNDTCKKIGMVAGGLALAALAVWGGYKFFHKAEKEVAAATNSVGDSAGKEITAVAKLKNAQNIARLADDAFTKNNVKIAQKAGYKVEELNVRGKKTTIIRDKDTNVILYSDRATADGHRIFSARDEETKKLENIYTRTPGGLMIVKTVDPETNKTITTATTADGKLQRRFVDGRVIEIKKDGEYVRTTEKYSGRVIREESRLK